MTSFLNWISIGNSSYTLNKDHETSSVRECVRERYDRVVEYERKESTFYENRSLHKISKYGIVMKKSF